MPQTLPPPERELCLHLANSLQTPLKRWHRNTKMKFVFFVLAALLACCCAFTQEDDVTFALRKKLHGVLEKFRVLMKTGDASKGIPVLDPFTAVQLPVNIAKEDLIELVALLTHVNVEGLAGYTIDEGEFVLAGLKCAVGLTWPEIRGSTDYVVDGEAVKSVKIFGNGTVTVRLTNFSFHTNLSLNVKNKKLNVKNMTSKISLGGINLKITGLYNDEEFSELVSAIVSDMLPQLITDYQPMISNLVNKVATEKLNEELRKMSMKDLLGMIG
ncbi:hypothetical protein KM043_009355 [Ampulex compressa]|nr:hypothetical protein KM043_009355 [Ampulex compressa]